MWPNENLSTDPTQSSCGLHGGSVPGPPRTVKSGRSSPSQKPHVQSAFRSRGPRTRGLADRSARITLCRCFTVPGAILPKRCWGLHLRTWLGAVCKHQAKVLRGAKQEFLRVRAETGSFSASHNSCQTEGFKTFGGTGVGDSLQTFTLSAQGFWNQDPPGFFH